MNSISLSTVIRIFCLRHLDHIIFVPRLSIFWPWRDSSVTFHQMKVKILISQFSLYRIDTLFTAFVAETRSNDPSSLVPQWRACPTRNIVQASQRCHLPDVSAIFETCIMHHLHTDTMKSQECSQYPWHYKWSWKLET